MTAGFRYFLALATDAAERRDYTQAQSYIRRAIRRTNRHTPEWSTAMRLAKVAKLAVWQAERA